MVFKECHYEPNYNDELDIEAPCPNCGRREYEEICFDAITNSNFFGGSSDIAKDMHMIHRAFKAWRQIKYAIFYSVGYNKKYLHSVNMRPIRMQLLEEALPRFLKEARNQLSDYDPTGHTLSTSIADLAVKTILLLACEEDPEVNFTWKQCYDELKRIKQIQNRKKREKRISLATELFNWTESVLIKVALLKDFYYDPEFSDYPVIQYFNSDVPEKRMLAILMLLKRDPVTKKSRWFNMWDILEGDCKPCKSNKDYYMEQLDKVKLFEDDQLNLVELALKYGLIHFINYFLLERRNFGFNMSMTKLIFLLDDIHEDENYDRLIFPWTAMVGIYSSVRYTGNEITSLRCDLARAFYFHSGEQLTSLREHFDDTWYSF